MTEKKAHQAAQERADAAQEHREERLKGWEAPERAEVDAVIPAGDGSVATVITADKLAFVTVDANAVFDQDALASFIKHLQMAYQAVS